MCVCEAAVSLITEQQSPFPLSLSPLSLLYYLPRSPSPFFSNQCPAAVKDPPLLLLLSFVFCHPLMSASSLFSFFHLSLHHLSFSSSSPSFPLLFSPLLFLISPVSPLLLLLPLFFLFTYFTFHSPVFPSFLLPRPFIFPTLAFPSSFFIFFLLCKVDGAE